PAAPSVQPARHTARTRPRLLAGVTPGGRGPRGQIQVTRWKKTSRIVEGTRAAIRIPNGCGDLRAVPVTVRVHPPRSCLGDLLGLAGPDGVGTRAVAGRHYDLIAGPLTHLGR